MPLPISKLAHCSVIHTHAPDSIGLFMSAEGFGDCRILSAMPHDLGVGMHARASILPRDILGWWATAPLITYWAVTGVEVVKSGGDQQGTIERYVTETLIYRDDLDVVIRFLGCHGGPVLRILNLTEANQDERVRLHRLDPCGTPEDREAAGFEILAAIRERRYARDRSQKASATP